MKRISLLFLFALLTTFPLLSQVPLGYVSVSSTYLQDSTGTLVANAKIIFSPVNNGGTPISYRVNGTGQVLDSPVSAIVANGAYTIQLADTSLTVPVNVCFAVTVIAIPSGKQLLGPGYSCVQPSGSGPAVTGTYAWCSAASGSHGGSCNFDTYVPNVSALAMVVYSGPAGATGPNSVTTSTTTNINAPLCGNGSNVYGCPLSDRGFLNGFVEECEVGSASAFSCRGDYMTNATGTPALASVTTTTPILLEATSTASSGSGAGWYGFNAIYLDSKQPSLTFLVAFASSTDYTGDRMWFGLLGNSCSVTTMIGSDNPACSYVAIRFSTVASDTYYECVTANGSNQTVTSIGVAPTTAPVAMNVSINASSASCTVNGTTVTNTTYLPASTTLLYDVFYNTNENTTAKHLEMNGFYGYYQPLNSTY